MTFQEYQIRARETAMYPDAGSNFVYPTLGLANEAGEVAGKVKKIFRDDNGHVTPERLEDIKGELGDVLWYTAQVASEFKLSLEDIASANLTKLASRKQRGVLQGSGDNR
ncbi:nucleoside triphosphate pyrophosphohydrolase family protein [Candidatus Uhrbacteria bacterium]|nr:nucleoside triphosphate pyrophosphohydrolase family protein [Candidatus Uhrbacteria bacterium]